MAVYGLINGHLWAWEDDGEFFCQGCFAQDEGCAWEDYFLEDSARRHVPALTRDGAATTTKDKNNDTGSPIRSGMTEGGRVLRGFGPARRGPFVSAKGPKTMGAGAQPRPQAP